MWFVFNEIGDYESFREGVACSQVISSCCRPEGPWKAQDDKRRSASRRASGVLQLAKTPGSSTSTSTAPTSRNTSRRVGPGNSPLTMAEATSRSMQIGWPCLPRYEGTAARPVALASAITAVRFTNGWSTGRIATTLQSRSSTRWPRPATNDANMSSPLDGSTTSARPLGPGMSVPGGSVATIGLAPAARRTSKQDLRNDLPSGSSAQAFGPPHRLPSPPAKISPEKLFKSTSHLAWVFDWQLKTHNSKFKIHNSKLMMSLR